MIKAKSLEAAMEWGDHLSMAYVSRNSENEFLRSNAELAESHDLPVVEYGETPTDQKIGW